MTPLHSANPAEHSSIFGGYGIGGDLASRGTRVGGGGLGGQIQRTIPRAYHRGSYEPSIVVEKAGDRPKYQKPCPSGSKPRDRLVSSRNSSDSEEDKANQSTNNIFALQDGLGKSFLSQSAYGARRARLFEGGRSESGKSLHPLLRDEIVWKKMETSLSPQRNKRSLSLSEGSYLRGPFLRTGVDLLDASRDSTMEYRYNKSLLSHLTSSLAQTSNGNQSGWKKFLLDGFIPGSKLRPSCVHPRDTGNRSDTPGDGNSRAKIFGRFHRNVTSRESTAGDCSHGGLLSAGRFYSQSRDKVSRKTSPHFEAFGFDNSSRHKSFRNSDGEDKRHKDFGRCFNSAKKMQSHNIGENNWEIDIPSTRLGTSEKSNLAIDRRSLRRPQISSEVRLVQESSFNRKRNSRTDLDQGESTSRTTEIFPSSSINAGIHRCSRRRSSGVGISRPSPFAPDRCRDLDSELTSETTKNSPQGVLCRITHGKSSSARIKDRIDHGFKNCAETGRGQRSQTKAGKITSPMSEALGFMQQEADRDCQSNLDQRLLKHHCRYALPTRAIRDARSSTTMAAYEKRFCNWTEWLHSVQLLASPHTLWLYLDQLRGTPEGRTARAVRSAIIYILKIKGDYFEPPRGDPPLAYSDERLKLIALGVEKCSPKLKHSPKLPVRWFHLQKLYSNGVRDQLWLRDISLLIIGLLALTRSEELASLSEKNFSFEDDGSILLHFRRVKVDIDAADTTIRMVDLIGFDFSLTAILREFIDSRKHCDFLFVSKYGKRLTANSISKILNQRLISELKFKGKFSSHSLRVGGACLAAECSKSEAVIKAIGGWKSNAFLRYIRDISKSFRMTQTF